MVWKVSSGESSDYVWRYAFDGRVSQHATVFSESCGYCSCESRYYACWHRCDNIRFSKKVADVIADYYFSLDGIQSVFTSTTVNVEYKLHAGSCTHF